MQAITVKFLAPTNTKGSRYKARAAAGSITVSSNHGMNPQQNARHAANMLCAKLKWENADQLVGGGLPNGDYVFVFNT